MNKFLLRVYASVGMLICLSYVAFMAKTIIEAQSAEWEISNSDYQRYLGSSMENVNWIVVILGTFLSLTLAMPWMEYFRHLWRDCSYRFWIFNENSWKGKIGSVLYVILNLFLVLLHLDLFLMPYVDCEGFAYRNNSVVVTLLTLLIPFYLVLTLAVYIKLEIKNKCYHDKDEI